MSDYWDNLSAITLHDQPKAAGFSVFLPKSFFKLETSPTIEPFYSLLLSAFRIV